MAAADPIGAVILYVAEGFGERFTRERAQVWRDALSGKDPDLLMVGARLMVKNQTVRPVVPSHLLGWAERAAEDRRMSQSTDTATPDRMIGERILPPEEAKAKIKELRERLARGLRA